MNSRLLTFLITLGFGIASFLLGPLIWPLNEAGAAPEGIQLPLLIGVSAIESVAFGLGVAFLIQGWPWVRRMAHGMKGIAWTLYISIAWFLISWWPHDRLHMSIDHDDLWTLIGLEYGFHLTLILAGAAIAYNFFTILQWGESHHARR